ncbi:protein kinase domain-containing protein [Reticulomyxa filosa]|uniref:non-specific serine/threonine protein kinase n=1 Tax=Reticulomyxa filosa TaxID=46433 RepID=X6MKH8_RETFI|nr:protein kinase domain-containing protein [Reticulomyxa filosa]|eukprot:ETO14513.1 protein kinase domain-containing protein [Reticulomyxa filosa]
MQIKSDERCLKHKETKEGTLETVSRINGLCIERKEESANKQQSDIKNSNNNKNSNDKNDSNTGNDNNMAVVRFFDPKSAPFGNCGINNGEKTLFCNHDFMSRYGNDFEETFPEPIGIGAFGTVHKVRHRLDGQVYAVKKILFSHKGFNPPVQQVFTSSSIKKKKKIFCPILKHTFLSILIYVHMNNDMYYTGWTEPLIITNVSKSKSKVCNTQTKANTNTNTNINININTNTNINVNVNVNTDSEDSPYQMKMDDERETTHNIMNKCNSDSWLGKAQESTTGLDREWELQKCRRQDPFTPDRRQHMRENDNTSTTTAATHRQVGEIFQQWHELTHYSCLFVQTEYCGPWTLKHFLRCPKRIHANKNVAMSLFAQILMGLTHVHGKNIIHRDLKPENIFVVRNENMWSGEFDTNQSQDEFVEDLCRNPHSYSIKIGDFGLSKCVSASHVKYAEDSDDSEIDVQLHTGGVGTQLYTAPELCQNRTKPEQNESFMAKYNQSADIYSLGVILLEMVGPHFDTEFERYKAIHGFIRSKQSDKETVLEKEQPEYQIIRAMTDDTPSRRPTAYELLSNDFVKLFWIQNIIHNAVPPQVMLPINNTFVNEVCSFLEEKQDEETKRAKNLSVTKYNEFADIFEKCVKKSQH